MTKKQRIIAIAVAISLFVGVVSVLRFNSWYNSSLQPVSANGEDVSFTVESGQTPEQIAKNLKSAGLIKSSRAFSLYLSKNNQRTSLQAGVYRLNPAMSTADIAKILINGSVDIYLLTILPGQRLDQIKQKLIDSGFSEEQVKKALMANYRHPLLSSKPKDASLEGYIFPESIQVDPKTSVEDIFEQSFELFWSEITDDVKQGIEKQGLSLHEAIILASIIEKESGNEADQSKIARVFLNRLAQDIELGSDVTFFYAAEILGVEPSVDLDSPYNTRKYKGLPPGPISNFNIGALKAVAFPESGSWMYFVAGDDGITRFSNTLEEHEALTEKYCKELCQL